MGRGQQMSISVEKPIGSGIIPEVKSLVEQRKLVIVALFAAFLPFVITRSYIYYMSPEATTEVLLIDLTQIGDGTSFHAKPNSHIDNNSVQPNNTHASMMSKSNETTMESLVPSAMNDTNARVKDKKLEKETLSNGVKGSSKITTLSSVEPSKSEGTNDLKENMNVSSNGELKENKDANKDASSNGMLKESKDKSSNGTLSSEGHFERLKGTTNVIEMSGPVTSNSTGSKTKGRCDLVKGSWVPDFRLPDYTNDTCRFIQGHQNCIKNGRPDLNFLNWRWKPEQCDLPRINAQAFLTSMRDQAMAFVGDSIARNQFQSLICLLSQVEHPRNIYHAPDDRDNTHHFPTFNFTLAVYWSPYLVHVEDKMVTWLDNRTQAVAHIHVDKLDEAWYHRVSGFDIVQISTDCYDFFGTKDNTLLGADEYHMWKLVTTTLVGAEGQWWFKRGLYLQNGKAIGGHICNGWLGCDKEIGFADPYRMAFHTILKGSLTIPGYNGVTVLRSFSPDHFEGGSWDSGGGCNRTAPGGVPLSSLTKWMYKIQQEEFFNVTSEMGPSVETRLKLLDITKLAQTRADGHPDAYREFQPYSKEYNKPILKDCLHWCLPGPIDTWNDLLVESLRERIYK